MSPSDWAFLLINVAPTAFFLSVLYFAGLKKAFEGIWEGLKSVVVRALDPVLGFSRRERERKAYYDAIDFQATVEALTAKNRQLGAEHRALQQAYALLLDGTPGAVKDAPEAPQVPAWGTPKPVEPVLPVTAADKRYVRRLEREREELREKVQNYQIMAGQLTDERDALRKQLQGFKNLGGGDPQALVDYVERMGADLARYKKKVEIAEGIAERATKTMESSFVEVDRLSREIGLMRKHGVLPMATFTDNEPSITMLNKQWERKYARLIEQTRVTSSEIPSGEYPYEIVNTIEHQDGTIDIFFRFTLEQEVDAEAVARRMMIQQCAKSQLMAHASTLHEDIVMSRAETRTLSYTYRYKAQRVTFLPQWG